jgi:Divergent InlB B-repeat domain
MGTRVAVVIGAFFVIASVCGQGGDSGSSGGSSAVAGGAPVTSNDPTQRAVHIELASGATGAGWVDLYIPAKQPGAQWYGCYIEPGITTCDHQVPQGSIFELVATPDNLSTFDGWRGDCTGTSTTCSFASAASTAVDVGAIFTGEELSVTFNVQTRPDTEPGVVSSDQGHIAPIPWWQGSSPTSDEAAVAWELSIPATGQTDVTFTAEPLSGDLQVARLDVFRDGEPIALLCGARVTTCTITLDADDIAMNDPAFIVYARFEPLDVRPPPLPNFWGQWTLKIDPGPSGDCVDDPEYTEDITISLGLAMSGGTQLDVTGIGGADPPTWPGVYWSDRLEIEFFGSKTEGAGTTTATFILTHDRETDTLDGTEEWVWNGSRGTCPDGLSTVTGSRPTP